MKEYSFGEIIASPPHEINSASFLSGVIDKLAPNYRSVSFSLINLTLQGMNDKDFRKSHRCEIESAFKYYILIRAISDDSDALLRFFSDCNLLAIKNEGRFVDTIKTRGDAELDLIKIEAVYVFGSESEI